MQQGSRK